MAGLKDVIERISAGGQAAKESLASGGTKEQAREAARQAGKQPSPFLQAAQTLAQSAQETARQPVQAMAPGMQQTASGETEEAEKSSMTKDREEKKEQKNEQQPIVPVYWYEPGANEAGLLTGMSGFQGDSDLAYGQDLRGGDDLRYGSDLSDSTMQKVGDNLRSAINAATRTTNVPHQTSGISDEEYQDERDKFAHRWGFDNYAEYEKERGQGTRESDFAKGYLNSLANRAENSPFSPTINSVDENGELVQTKLFEGLPDRIRNYEPPNNIAEQTPKNPSLAEDEGMPAIPASQMAEFYNWSLGTEEGNAFMAAHPEFYDTDLGYATVEDYVNGTGSGYGRLLGTNDRDIWSALL
ncbi:MAG: hypothetical protein IJ127_01395, partial [Afipia sp.]|nr:hypothetical protein [Afipia sp.]